SNSSPQCCGRRKCVWTSMSMTLSPCCKRLGGRLAGGLQQPVDVGLGVSVGHVAALEVQRNLKDTLLDLPQPVIDEQLGVVAQQIPVVADRPVHEEAHEDRPEATDDRVDAQVTPDLLQTHACSVAQSKDM